MRVLFVDDDKGISQSVETALRRKGHEVDTAHLGADALALIEDTAYDLVVLDVGLPDMDGYHIVRRMKIDQIETPVLMQTGLAGQDLIDDAQTLGVQAILAKPFSIHELIECMDSLVTPPGGATHEPRAVADPTVPARPAPQPEPQAAQVPDPGHRTAVRPAPRPDPAPPPQNSPASGRALRRALMTDADPAANAGPKVEPAPPLVADPAMRSAPEPGPAAVAVTAEEPTREALPAVSPAPPSAPQEVPADDGDNRRSADRTPTVEAALITEDGNLLACVIVDLSEGGAQVKLAAPSQSCPKMFTLKPLEGPERRCEVRWRSGARLGLKFT